MTQLQLMPNICLRTAGALRTPPIPRGIRIVQAAIVVAAAGIVAVSIWWTRSSRTASPIPSPARTAAEVNGSLLQIDGATTG